MANGSKKFSQYFQGSNEDKKNSDKGVSFKSIAEKLRQLEAHSPKKLGQKKQKSAPERVPPKPSSAPHQHPPPQHHPPPFNNHGFQGPPNFHGPPPGQYHLPPPPNFHGPPPGFNGPPPPDFRGPPPPDFHGPPSNFNGPPSNFNGPPPNGFNGPHCGPPHGGPPHGPPPPFHFQNQMPPPPFPFHPPPNFQRGRRPAPNHNRPPIHNKPPFKKRKLNQKQSQPNKQQSKKDKSSFDGKITEDEVHHIMEIRESETPEKIARYLKRRRAKWPTRSRQNHLAEKQAKLEAAGVTSGKKVLTIQQKLKKKRQNNQKKFRQNFARRESNLLGAIFAKEIREEERAMLDCIKWISKNMIE